VKNKYFHWCKWNIIYKNNLKVKNGSNAKILIRNDGFICKFLSLLMESRKSVGPSATPDFYDKLFTFLAAVMRCNILA